jgi:hypothetical protein
MPRYTIKRSPAGWNVYDITKPNHLGLPHLLVGRHATREDAEREAERLNRPADQEGAEPIGEDADA